MDNKNMCESCSNKLLTLKGHVKDMLNQIMNDLRRRQIEDNLFIKKLESSIEFVDQY